ncbi:MAG: DPP IV N-terminal domain-containing protein [Candidatus Cloacimonetes bacterium]|nr:DPP IV N-terminal domain-containing protein [Candidatus Cloacimonadota bacterium]
MSIVALLGAIAPTFMTDPAISPDGSTVCFVYMSDLWLVPFEGGEARRITVSDAEDSGPVWSPDGEWIAFMSNRDGRGNIWMAPAGGGPARQISREELSIVDWYPDGKHLLAYGGFTPRRRGYFKLSVDDGRPVEIVAFGNFYADLSHDAGSIVFCRRGDPFRERYQGSAAGELWRYDIDDNSFLQLTHTQFTERYPVCSKQSDAVYYAASDGEIFQLFRAVNGDFAHPEQLSSFDVWSARDLSIARSSDRLVFEYFDCLGTWDPATGRTAVIDIDIRQDYIGILDERETLRNRVDAYAVSPSGKFIVFAAKYDLFVVPAEGGEVRQVTTDNRGVENIAVMDDNRTIYFSRRVEGVPRLFKTDITALDEIEEVAWSRNRYIEYIYHGPQDLLVISYSQGEERNRVAIMDSVGIETVIDERMWGGTAIDPSGEWILSPSIDSNIYTGELQLRNRLTGEKHDLLGSEDWIHGLAFGTDRRTAFFTKDGDIWRLDLAAKPVDYQEEDPWDEILAAAVEADEDEDEAEDEDDEEESEDDTGMLLDLAGISSRIERIVDPPGHSYIVHVIDDSTFYYMNYFDEKETLRKAHYDGSGDEEVANLGSDIHAIRWNEGTGAFYYIENDQLYKLDPKKKRPEAVRYETRYTWNRLKLNQEILRQVWVEFGLGFYDPEMHGHNWDRVWERYGAYSDDLITTKALTWIVDEMIGDVNASHTGFYARSERKGPRLGLAQTGAVLDWVNRPARGIDVIGVFSESKLASPGGIEAGDLLLSIDGEPITRNTPIMPMLVDKVGDEIELEFDIGEDTTRTVKIVGLGYGDVYDMWYHDWTVERRRMVDELSNDRIGYLHIEQMGGSSFEKFLDELFYDNIDKEALIIDIRFNGGGHTHDDILEALTKKRYGYQTHRGRNNEPFPTPGRTWEKPLVVLINEESFSDAEIFPILFKELGLGKVIGMPTSGGVIGTGHITFMDGSGMRMPRNGWFTLAGENMEGMGAAPDIEVDMTPEQIIEDDDVQLQTAVEALLNDL